MKCMLCKQEGDYFTTDGKSICSNCLPKSKYRVCTCCGKVITMTNQPYFTNESLCEECFQKQE